MSDESTNWGPEQHGPQAGRTRRGSRPVVIAMVVLVVALVAAATAWLVIDRGTDQATRTSVLEDGSDPGSTSAPSSTSSTSSAPPTSGGAGAAVPYEIPDDLVLPGEGEPSDGEFSAWEPTDEPLVPPCESVADPAARLRPADVRIIERTGPERLERVGLLVFEDADVASTYVSDLVAAATECIGQPSEEGETTSVGELPGVWGQGATWVDAYPENGETGEPYGLGGTYTLVARVGNAVAFSIGYGEWQPAVSGADPDAVAEYRAPLDELAPRLCVFTEDGC